MYIFLVLEGLKSIAKVRLSMDAFEMFLAISAYCTARQTMPTSLGASDATKTMMLGAES